MWQQFIFFLIRVRNWIFWSEPKQTTSFKRIQIPLIRRIYPSLMPDRPKQKTFEFQD